ncbi:MAG: HEAT repeat domain-containing protein [Labilithrix sp.]|nr:HEAT repeat domain-containing protein [Labilithrix sp.]MCW5813627.1 HEAT repeat domain-containing protein [Labilithrix sp.]
MRSRLCLGLLFALSLAPASAEALVWPDVPERVERGLSSPDPATRRIAARDLASLGGARATPLVLKAMNDGDVDVRLAAAQSAIRLRVQGATDIAITWLGERETRLRVAACEVAHAMPNPRAVQPVARALGDSDQQVRFACADALGSSGSAEAIAPLAAKLDDPTPNVRVQVARALARLGDARAVVPLVGKVQDSVPDVRQAVVRALGDLGDGRATQALLLALRDNVAEVRIEALAALGRLRAPEAALAIAPLALDRNLGVRQSALVALGRIGTPNAVKALIQALGTQEDATAGLERTPVRDALVSAGQPAAVELTALLDRPITPAVATSAAWVLGELRSTASAPAIVAALRKGTLPPAAALRALTGCGSAAEVPVVLEYVSDPSPQAREEALKAATALLDPAKPDGRAVEPLAATLNNPRTSPRERAAVATLLGRTGAPRAATELVGLVSAKDETLRLAAIDALGALGGAASVQEQADDALVPLLADTEPAVRLHAAVAIAASGGAKARKLLLAKLDGGEELDRYALFTALGGVLERVPEENAARRVLRELGVAAGPERDAVIEAAGRARLPSMAGALATAAKTTDVDDRRAIATMLAAHPGAIATARALASDPDPGVRANAAWALGAIGDASTIGFLDTLLRAGDADTAANAAAAIGRVGRRAGADEATRALCNGLADGRAAVRANALSGLAALKRRCGDGRAERKLLADDPHELVRAGAARALGAAPVGDDRAVVDRCAVADRSAEVARLCRPRTTPATASTKTHAVTVFVVGEAERGRDAEASRIRARAPYVLQYEDGMLRTGAADRRGATVDPTAPEGTLTLRRAL